MIKKSNNANNYKSKLKNNHKGGNKKSRHKININDFVTTNKGECADFVGNGGICSENNIINAVVKLFDNIENDIENIANAANAANAANIANIANAASPDIIKNVVNKAKKKLNCDSEFCVVTHPEFKKHALKNHMVTRKELEINSKKRFKIKGPRNNVNWLSNYDIDTTLQDWACKFEDFFPCPFAMIDFDKTNDELNQYNLVDIYLGNYTKVCTLGHIRIPCRTFGCAINTDVKAGHGKHWMAIFVDMRGPEWTIEFFNSAGDSPQSSIVRWMARTKNYLDLFIQDHNQNSYKLTTTQPVKIVTAASVGHQESSTECGLYTLFYIRCRLENVPYSRFLEDEEIPDESMMEFRKHCFR